LNSTICWIPKVFSSTLRSIYCLGGISLAEQEAIAGKTCSDCGAELSPGAEICTKCGLIQSSTVSPIKENNTPPIEPTKERNPVIAAVLTLILIPAGYWYVKRLKRGLIVFLIALIIGILAGEWGVYIIAAIAIYDVYRLAKKESASLDFLGRWGLA